MLDHVTRGLVMADSPSPETPGRSSSIRRSAVSAPSSMDEWKDSPTVRASKSAKPATSTQTNSAAESANQEDNTPTIISTSRARSSPDANIGESLQGRRLGHFELLEPIGVGGMAAVIRARDLDLNRIVALKILPPEMATDPENITRFKQEARAAAKLDHENVARVYYCGEDQGLHFIAFEFVEGENLRTLLERRGPLPVKECLRYMLQIAQGLAHAASRGVVHRDIKPSNILISPDGKAKIVDMGLARNLDPHTVNGGVTQSGVTLGTFDYISPEQALEPRQADARSDIYSLGCTFYHVLTGQPPVPEGTAAKKLHYHQYVQPIDPRHINPYIPDDLTAVLAKMMAKDPNQRFQSPESLVTQLQVLAQRYGVNELQVQRTNDDVSPGNHLPQDTLTPVVPHLPIWSVVTSVFVLLLIVHYLTGGSQGANELVDPTPPWQTERFDNVPSIAKNDIPTVSKESPPTPVLVGTSELDSHARTAHTATELLELLRLSASHILLTGEKYDLTTALGDSTRPLVYTGRTLVLESSNPANPPTIQLFPGMLIFRPRGLNSSLEFRGIRFDLTQRSLTSTPPLAIEIENFNAVKMNRCEFIYNSGTLLPGVSLAITQKLSQRDSNSSSLPPAASSKKPINVELMQCFFAGASAAVRLNGMIQLRATDCFFAPHPSIFDVVRSDRDSTPNDSTARTSITLQHCSSILEAKNAIINVAPSIGCRVELGHNLFASITTLSPEAVVLRQTELHPATSVRGLANEDNPNQFCSNGYFHIAAYDDGQRAFSWQNCRDRKLPIDDRAAILLLQRPWQSSLPSDWSSVLPSQTFLASLERKELRISTSRQFDSILGGLHFRGSSLYAFPLPAINEAPAVALGKRKYWQPRYPANEPLPPHVYRSLSEAVEYSEPGDEILIRENGFLKISPIELARVGTQLTIKPDTGYKPVLLLNDTLKANASMFTLFDGKIQFENLEFLLRPGKTQKGASRSVVTLANGGDCKFKNCVLTLEESEEALVSMIALSDPEGEMKMNSPDKWPTPKMHLDGCFLRGKGRLLNLKISRPFELEINSNLIVLDGSLATIEGGSKEPTGANPAIIRLNRTTTFLTKHLLHLIAAPSVGDSKVIGLVQTRVTATGCLFCPAGSDAGAFIRFERVDSETQWKEKELLVWQGGRHNLYGYSNTAPMLEIVPEVVTDIPMSKPFTADQWLAFTLETSGRPFGRVRFAVPPANDQPFTSVRPSDFRIQSIDPPFKPDGEVMVPLGAPIDQFEEARIEPIFSDS